MRYQTHVLEQPKSKTLPAPSVDQDINQQELLFIMKLVSKWQSHIGRQLAVSYQVNYQRLEAMKRAFNK